jgi:hypothetical protein
MAVPVTARVEDKPTAIPQTPHNEILKHPVTSPIPRPREMSLILFATAEMLTIPRRIVLAQRPNKNSALEHYYSALI